jgi:hypothetical protein
MHVLLVVLIMIVLYLLFLVLFPQKEPFMCNAVIPQYDIDYLTRSQPLLFNKYGEKSCNCMTPGTGCSCSGKCPHKVYPNSPFNKCDGIGCKAVGFGPQELPPTTEENDSVNSDIVDITKVAADYSGLTDYRSGYPFVSSYGCNMGVNDGNIISLWGGDYPTAAPKREIYYQPEMGRLGDSTMTGYQIGAKAY